MTYKIIEIILMEPEEVRGLVGTTRWARFTSDRHTFKLGLGPCGRTVESLDCEVSNGVLEITQKCEEDDEPDYFGYPLHSVRRYKVYSTDDPCPAKNKQ